MERDGPKLVGLAFASEDLELILVHMNLIFVEEYLTIVVT